MNSDSRLVRKISWKAASRAVDFLCYTVDFELTGYFRFCFFSIFLPSASCAFSVDIVYFLLLNETRTGGLLLGL